MTLLSLLVGLSGSASAFCGAFVGEPGADLVSRTSRVILARDGDTTTLTVANDYEGALNQFALLIPVPEVLEENDVRELRERVREPDAVGAPYQRCEPELHGPGGQGEGARAPVCGPGRTGRATSLARLSLPNRAGHLAETPTSWLDTPWPASSASTPWRCSR